MNQGITFLIVQMNQNNYYHMMAVSGSPID